MIGAGGPTNERSNHQVDFGKGALAHRLPIYREECSLKCYNMIGARALKAAPAVDFCFIFPKAAKEPIGGDYPV